MSFESFALPKSLQKAVDELGLSQPTPIQERAFPVVMSGRDVMGIAQTGTGKTFAYLLPLLKQYRFTPTHTPKIVILVPTRELVVQVADEAAKLAKYMSVRILGIYGGVNINTQKTAVYEGVDLLVGTPGRVMDLALDNVIRFDETAKLVIDEFDEMLNLGFRPQLTSILTMMRPKRQNILFSATMTEEVDEMLDEYFDFPEEVSLAPSGTPLESIRQVMYAVPNFNTKIALLAHLLETEPDMTRLLVFLNNKRIADLLHERLEEQFPGQFGLIHSNKSQNYRLNTMADFRNGDIRGIITTDVMSRGLDIPAITHVLNFDIPETPELYIHRIGRTGRAQAEGVAISFFTPKEEEAKIEAEMLMDKEIPTTPLPEAVEVSDKLMPFEKERQKIKNLSKKARSEDSGTAFHEKATHNKKVNLGGPGKTKKKTGSVNRGLLKARAAKKKKK
ncbi:MULTISPECIES: DEAD/DEAH box helicase [unclassified Flavobacterium]|uniref:DEAD/DEAH box helicase n=1 Tax=unclassified Flavobacterium TaxID=196869 RepID=UPI001F13A4FA|nr:MULTISPECIES: DEAD/DEAH box helicase [unclassified Flavobacterium]UMY64659.1 DEAD/DEAH box helicase [Flavobacterium sp. HJ-32-4]